MLSNVAMEHSAYKPSLFSGTGLSFTSVIATSYVGLSIGVSHSAKLQGLIDTFIDSSSVSEVHDLWNPGITSTVVPLQQ